MKVEKELFKTRQELNETKKYYEERIQMMDAQIRKLTTENQKLTQDSFLQVQNLAKFFNQSGVKLGQQHSAIDGMGNESCDISSLFVNGASFEEFKEIALNMKLPLVLEKNQHSNAQPKTHAKEYSTHQFEPVSDLNVNKFMTQESDSPSKVAQESNYISNEGMKAGITENNRRMLNH